MDARSGGDASDEPHENPAGRRLDTPIPIMPTASTTRIETALQHIDGVLQNAA
jgi:hypothetical protein